MGLRFLRITLYNRHLTLFQSQPNPGLKRLWQDKVAGSLSASLKLMAVRRQICKFLFFSSQLSSVEIRTRQLDRKNKLDRITIGKNNLILPLKSI